jgi:hypothetical protein
MITSAAKRIRLNECAELATRTSLIWMRFGTSDHIFNIHDVQLIIIFISLTKIKDIVENLFKLSSGLIVERHLPTIASDAYEIGFVEETRTTRDQYRGNKLIRESIFIRSTRNNIFFCKKYFVGPRWKALKTIALHTKKNFRLWDKNHAPFKLNGQSRTVFGLLKA